MSEDHELRGDGPRPPDLQEWVTRYGGYDQIPWVEWDRAVADYHRERRAVLRGEISARSVS